MARPRAAHPIDLLAGGQIERGEVHMHGQERGEHEQKMELARQGHAAAVAAGAEAARVALAAKEKEMKEDGKKPEDKDPDSIEK
jgi:hypothetical protein